MLELLLSIAVSLPIERTFRIPACDTVVRMELSGYVESGDVLKVLAKKYGAGAVALGTMDPKETSIRVLAFTGAQPSADAWRKMAMGNQIVGSGQFDAAGAACTETVRDLNPPYSETTRRGFFALPGGTLEVDTTAMQEGDRVVFSRADFEKLLGAMQFAIVRHGSRADLPAKYLELSNTACVRPDGIDWLAARAAEKDADWTVKLAAAEHATSALGIHEIEMDDSTPLRPVQVDPKPLYDAVLSALDAAKRTDREAQFARVLAHDGLALAAARANDVDTARKEMSAARAIDAETKFDAHGSLSFDEACVCGAAKDGPGAAAALKAAFDADVTSMGRVARSPLLHPVLPTPEVMALMPKLGPHKPKVLLDSGSRPK